MSMYHPYQTYQKSRGGSPTAECHPNQTKVMTSKRKRKEKMRRRRQKDFKRTSSSTSSESSQDQSLSNIQGSSSCNQNFFDHAENTSVADSVFVTVIKNGMPPKPEYLGPSRQPSILRPVLEANDLKESVRSPIQIYYSHLLLQKRGVPLWHPAPNIQLPPAYRREGVRIGDVGTYDELGGFSFLFNIFETAQSEINNNSVPNGFTPLRRANPVAGEGHDVIHYDEEQRSVYDSGSWLGSQEVEETVTQTNGWTFRIGAGEGAILTMPQGAISKGLKNRQALRRYMSINLEEWYIYAIQRRGWDVNNGDLHLVYGCDKVASWGISTFWSTNRVGGDERTVHFVPAPPGYESNAAQLPKFRWKGLPGGCGRTGPSGDDLKDLFPLTNDRRSMTVDGEALRQADGTIVNQCVFLRTMNHMLSDALWHGIAMGGPQPSGGSSDGKGGTGGGDTGGESRTGGPGIDGNSPQTGQGGGSSSLDSQSYHGGSTWASFNQRSCIEGRPVPFTHPSVSLNRSLLRQYPHARMVVTEDEDWMEALDTLTLGQLSMSARAKLLDLGVDALHFKSLLSQSFEVVECEGVVSLQRRNPSEPRKKPRFRVSKKRHREFYSPGGDLRLVAGSTLFKIRESRLDRSAVQWLSILNKGYSKGCAIPRHIHADEIAALLMDYYDYPYVQPGTATAAPPTSSPPPLAEMRLHEECGDEDSDNGGGTWIVRPGPKSPWPPVTVQIDSESTTPFISTKTVQRANRPPGVPVKDLFAPPNRAARRPDSTFVDATDTDSWAKRPLPEDIYDHLEKFFPTHDLDKPVIEASSGDTSPTSLEPAGALPALTSPATPISLASAATATVVPTATIMQAPPPVVDESGKIHRGKKSIRIVAQEHKKKIDRTSRASDNSYANMMRKRSTKLWGSKLEEATTNQARNVSSSLVSSFGDLATFKWVRGELIGKGPYGRVYLALNATTGEMFAVKQVELPQTASDKADSRQHLVVQALKSESETLRDLDHPHIVQYLGFEETPTNLSIFMEYVPGGSVGSCLLKYGRFEDNITRSFTSQILGGLEYLHSMGILHRDLKADNILVEMTGTCKISDFGISKRTEDIHGAAHTAMQGTIFWMAPELINTQESGYNNKIDIWSVGCVVLEMWAGMRPWNGEDMLAVMFKLYQSKQPPPVPEDIVLSLEADDFRTRCFAINPDERPSAAELRRHPYLTLPPDWIFKGFT